MARRNLAEFRKRLQSIVRMIIRPLQLAGKWFRVVGMLALVTISRAEGRDPGLVGIVFDNPGLQTPMRVWTVAEPRAELLTPIARNDFSMTLGGWLRAPDGGEFELRVEAKDGVRLRVDGRTVVDAWETGGIHEARVPAGASPQRRFEFDYCLHSGRPVLEVSWRINGERAWHRIPAEAFSHTPGERAQAEARHAALMTELDKVLIVVNNPAPERRPALSFVQQGPRDLLRVDFSGAALAFDAWMYEKCGVELEAVRDLGDGRLEVRHRRTDPPGGEVVTVVTPGDDFVELVARCGEEVTDTPRLNLCWQLRRAPLFSSFPDPYPDFARRCFIFTEAGRTFLDRTVRLKAARFPEDAPVNNPPWVQTYLPVWDGEAELPFPWAGVSPDRFTATVAGVMSRDGRWLAALANDSATSISQVWIDCFHNNPEWRRPASGGAPEWRLKIYLQENDPTGLLIRVAQDFPEIRSQPAFRAAAGGRPAR
jgi:hypothetical protein